MNISKLKDLALYYSRKGSAGSGDWGHRGRPGKVGGSGGGGGLSTIGVKPGSPVGERKRHASAYRIMQRLPTADHNELTNHYKLNDKQCKKYPKECASLTFYTGSDYSIINSNLRGIPQDWQEKAFSDAHKEAIVNMDKAFDTFPRVPKTIRVTRSVADNVLDKMTPGTVFRDDGYVSTTISGMSMSKMQIKVPKGSKGIYVSEISNFSSERELLFPRGSRFKVLTKDKNTNRVVVELLPPEGN